MNRVLAFLLGILMLGCSKGPMPPAGFTDACAQAIRAAQPALGVSVEKDLRLRITDAQGKDSTALLDNAYQLYLQDPASGDEVIRRYVAAIIETRTTERTVERDRIVPVIKDRPWLAEMDAAVSAQQAEKPFERVFEDLNEDLVIVYAVDSPNNISYITPEDLTAKGLQRTELRELAIGNLRKILPKLEFREGPLFSMIPAGGDYDASLLLIDEIWTGGSIRVAGDIVVAIPSRDVLLVSGSGNDEGIAKLREMATQAMEGSPYRLTDKLFVFRDGRFTRFEANVGR